MKLELKDIQYAEFASKETHCYKADLYINDVNDIKVAKVGNNGDGGPDFVYFVNKTSKTKIEAYIKTLPPEQYTYTIDGITHHGELAASLESVCEELLLPWLTKDEKTAKGMPKEKIAVIGEMLANHRW